MAKATMQKWQRDHFIQKLNKQYDPLIEAAELKLKSIEAEAVEIAQKNLADEIGATPIIEELQTAIDTVKQKMSKAARFFRGTKKDVSYKFKEKNFDLFGYGANRITPEDCWEQVSDWAAKAARAKIAKTPEGKVLWNLQRNKEASRDEIMEAGSPDQLKTKLDNNLKKDGLTWFSDVKQLPNVKPETGGTMN